MSCQDLVHRAFDLAKRTGDVVIGKQNLELGDNGVKLVGTAWQQTMHAPALETRIHAQGRAAMLKNDFTESTTIGMSSIVASQSLPLTSLSLCNHGIGNAGATTLAAALKDNVFLQQLALNYNKIGSQGASALSHKLITVHKLHTLSLGNNCIGPMFPEELAACNSLTHLHLQHNVLLNVSVKLGNHPSLVKLELTGNRGMCIPNAGTLIQEKRHREISKTEHQKQTCNPLKGVKEMSPSMCDQADAVHGELMDWNTTKLRKFLIDIQLNMCEQERYRNLGELDEAIPHMSEVGFTLADRWNKPDPEYSDPESSWEVDYIDTLLSSYTNLQSLNGLQEWPSPPLAVSPTWNITQSLANPLYECRFIKNRLLNSVNITGLVIDKNDLRGRAAKEIAEALTNFQKLSLFSAQECVWDDSIAELAGAVRQCSQLLSVNGQTLTNTDNEWDLRGCVRNVVDAAFINRMLIDKGPLGNLSSLDLRGNRIQRSSAVLIAAGLTSVQNLTMLNGISLPEPPDPVMLSPTHSNDDGDDELDTVLESPQQSQPALPNPPVFARVVEALDMRKKLINGRVEDSPFGATFGTLTIELS